LALYERKTEMTATSTVTAPTRIGEPTRLLL
jgi:hypothetical protein